MKVSAAGYSYDYCESESPSPSLPPSLGQLSLHRLNKVLRG